MYSMNRYHYLMQELTDFGDAPLEKQSPNPVSEEELDAVEKSLGSSLPPDYREFLRQYGGFNVHKSFSIPESHSSGRREDIGGFLDAKSPFAHRPSMESYDELLPLAPIAIGFGEKGYILLALSEVEKGCIYFWDRGENPSNVESENIHLVANTFDDFIKSLHLYGPTL